MKRGYVKLWRKFKDNPYCNKPAYVSLWIFILLSVNHKKKKFAFNGKIVEVKEGQFITGRKEISISTGIPETSCERILKVLETSQQIGQQKTNKYRLITVNNWKSYQGNGQDFGQQMDNKWTTNGHKQ